MGQMSTEPPIRFIKIMCAFALKLTFWNKLVFLVSMQHGFILTELFKILLLALLQTKKNKQKKRV